MGTSIQDYKRATGDTNGIHPFYAPYLDWKASAAAQAERSTPTSAKTPNGGTSLYSKDTDIAVGQKVGQNRFQQYYGQQSGQTGGDVQNIKNKLVNRMEGSDPVSGQQQNAMSRSLRRLKAQGGSQQQIDEKARGQALDYSSAQYGRQGSAINDYRRLISNMLTGGQNLEMGFASLEKSGQQTYQPQYRSGGISVICTELHSQGVMSDEIYKEDSKYGIKLLGTNPFIMVGYVLWATYVVALMKKSKLFTKIISVPAMAWANNMAGNTNFLGKILKTIGEPICETIGRIYIWRRKWTMQRKS